MSEASKLHLYVKSKRGETALGPNDLKCYHAWAFAPHGGVSMMVGSTSYDLTEEDNKIKQILEKYADRYNVEIVIHDLAQKDEMGKAKSDGIQSTPSIVMGKRKITNVPTDEASLYKLLDVPEKEMNELIAREPILTVTIEGVIVCKDCGSQELKIYSDGSGYCLKCNKTFQTLKPPLGGRTTGR